MAKIDKLWDKINTLSKKDKQIKEIKSDIFDILSETSKSERLELRGISSKEYCDEKNDAVRKRNLSFITPHLDAFWEEIKKNFDKVSSGDNGFSWEIKKNFDKGNWDQDNLIWETNFLDREYDRKYWSTKKPILDKKTFNKKEVDGLSEKEVKQKYKNEHLKNLPQNIQERIKKLSVKLIKENNGKYLKEDTIVAIPAYVKDDIDEHKKAILAIKNQQGDFKTIFYVNWFDEEYDKSGQKIKTNVATSEMMDKRISELRQVVWDDDRIIVIWNLYKARKPIWTIRADISDAIIKSMRDQIPDQENRSLVCLDADTWKMDDGYIEGQKKVFKKNKDIKYSVWKLRRSTSNPKWQELVWLNEIIGLSWWKLQPHNQSKEVFSSGAVSSFRMKDYMKVKGFERGLWKWEDSSIWKKIERFESKDGSHENKDTGYWYNKKVFVDPKRSQQAIMNWEQAWQQRSGKDFNPVDKDKKNTTKKWERYDLGAKLTEVDLDYANQIIGKLITNKTLSDIELNQVQKYINNVVGDFRREKSKNSTFMKFSKLWNIQVKSKYFVDIRHWKMVFENKNISAESLLSQGAENISSGLQYRVFKKWDTIYKIPNTDDQILAQKKRLQSTQTLESIRQERDFAIYKIRHNNIFGDNWSNKLLANSKMLDNWIIIQDKAIVLQESIEKYEKENDMDKQRVLFEKYAESVLKTRKYWFSDYVFNFWYNSWLDREGRVVLFDFGEIYTEKSKVLKLIKDKKRTDAYDYSQLNNKSKRLYKTIMDNYITEKNLNKYRWVNNKNSK